MPADQAMTRLRTDLPLRLHTVFQSPPANARARRSIAPEAVFQSPPANARARRSALLLTTLVVVAVGLGPAGPARAADTGTIEGRVVNASSGGPQPGVRVILLGTRGDGSLSLRQETTDRRGRFSFNRLRTGDDRAYALDARFDGGVFSGEPISLPSNTSEEPVIKSTLRVWKTTSGPAAVLIRRDDLFLVQGDDGNVGVIESVTVLNQTDRAYVGRGAALGGTGIRPAATLGFSLPEAAEGVRIEDSDIERLWIRTTEYGFAATAAIPPGEWRTTFSYRLRGSGGSFDLGRTALYPIVEMSVHAVEPLDVRSNRLSESGEVVIEGRRYRRWSTTEAIDAADPIQAVAVAEAGLAPALIGGLVVLALALVGAIAFGLVRRRGHAPQRPETRPRSRDELVAAIAELDLRHERGEVSDDEWTERRAELKHRAVEQRTPERTP
jgi:hypothetical protein